MHILNISRLFLANAACALVCLPAAVAAPAHNDFDFDITVSLSPKAAAELQSTQEGITVLVSYYGVPRKHAQQHANEIGLIDLGSATIDRAGRAGPVHINGNTIDTERMKWIQGPPKVNVNLFSSRKVNADNILSCDFIDGDVRDAKSAPVPVHCTLADENIDPEHKL